MIYKSKGCFNLNKDNKQKILPDEEFIISTDFIQIKKNSRKINIYVIDQNPINTKK